MEYKNLTIPQQNIWNLQRFYQDTSIANQCGATFYNEKRNLDKLKKAINMVVEKQSGFRLCFRNKKKAVQYVKEYRLFDIPEMAFSSEAEFDEYANSFAKEPIFKEDAELYRFVVFNISGKSGILVVLSHLISDAWTFSILAKEVDKAYQFLEGLGKKPLEEGNYLDYIASEKEYLESEKYKKDEEFWNKKFQNRPEEAVIKIPTGSMTSSDSNRTVRQIPQALRHLQN